MSVASHVSQLVPAGLPSRLRWFSHRGERRMISEFAHDVCVGLRKGQKELLSKYLYDELGSALFDAITVLPEYGLTRADQRLLERHAPEIPREFPIVAEFGSGSGRKTRAVLEALHPPEYF